MTRLLALLLATCACLAACGPPANPDPAATVCNDPSHHDQASDGLPDGWDDPGAPTVDLPAVLDEQLADVVELLPEELHRPSDGQVADARPVLLECGELLDLALGSGSATADAATTQPDNGPSSSSPPPAAAIPVRLQLGTPSGVQGWSSGPGDASTEPAAVQANQRGSPSLLF